MHGGQGRENWCSHFDRIASFIGLGIERWRKSENRAINRGKLLLCFSAPKSTSASPFEHAVVPRGLQQTVFRVTGSGRGYRVEFLCKTQSNATSMPRSRRVGLSTRKPHQVHAQRFRFQCETLTGFTATSDDFPNVPVLPAERWDLPISAAGPCFLPCPYGCVLVEIVGLYGQYQKKNARRTRILTNADQVQRRR